MVRISSLASTLSTRAFSTLMILPRSGRIACVFGSRPPLAVPPAESPSTRNSSLSAGLRVLAVDELAGQPRAFERVLAAREIARFLGGVARALRLHALVDDRARVLRILFEEEIEPLVDEPETMLRTFALPSLVLVWPSNCGSCSLTETTAVRPSMMSSVESELVRFLEHAALARVAVDRRRDGLAEALQMHAAFDRVDVVGVGEDLLGVRVGVLHRDFDVDAVAFGVRRDDRVQRVLLLVEPLDERDDAAVELVTALARRLRRARRAA